MKFSELSEKCPWFYEDSIQDVNSVGLTFIFDQRLCSITEKKCEDSNCGLSYLLSIIEKEIK